MEKLLEALKYCTSNSDLYQQRLSDFYFEKKNEGKTEFDFVSEEFNLANTCYFDLFSKSKKDSSLIPLFEKVTDYYDFIDSKQKSLEPFYKNSNQITAEVASAVTLQWKGTVLEFIELTKAIIECRLVSPELTDKEIFDGMKQVFNVKDFDKSSRLKEIRKRTIDLTPLINKLEIGLTTWIKKKD